MPDASLKFLVEHAGELQATDLARLEATLLNVGRAHLEANEIDLATAVVALVSRVSLPSARALHAEVLLHLARQHYRAGSRRLARRALGETEKLGALPQHITDQLQVLSKSIDRRERRFAVLICAAILLLLLSADLVSRLGGAHLEVHAGAVAHISVFRGDTLIRESDTFLVTLSDLPAGHYSVEAVYADGRSARGSTWLLFEGDTKTLRVAPTAP